MKIQFSTNCLRTFGAKFISNEEEELIDGDWGTMDEKSLRGGLAKNATRSVKSLSMNCGCGGE